MEDEIIRMTLDVDQADYEVILQAVAKYQAIHHARFGEKVMAECDGDMRGAILTEICQAWLAKH
jgi:hypothetical protein